jgi:hypothetical protein
MAAHSRTGLAAGLLVLASVLSGCQNFDMDKLDVFGLTDKTKLPGDRKPVFPEGVPGVAQGVPQHLIKGNQPGPETAQTGLDPAPKLVEAPPNTASNPATKPAPKRKPTPKPKRVVRAPAAPKPATGQQSPWPAQQQQPGTQAPWPSNAAQQPASSAPWPTAPEPGTFSR